MMVCEEENLSSDISGAPGNQLSQNSCGGGVDSRYLEFVKLPEFIVLPKLRTTTVVRVRKDEGSD
jgi:hypothetical protein